MLSNNRPNSKCEGQQAKANGRLDPLHQDVQELCRVGVALSREKDIDKLLETIVSVARRFTKAEGCTLYLCNEEQGVLEFAVVQNERLGIYQTGSHKQNNWPNIPLFNEDGSENHSNVSAHCALSGDNINISDAYYEDGFDFSNTRSFDKLTGYRSRSMLLVPMLDNRDNVIGVLQLLNAKSEKTKETCDFNLDAAEVVKGLASQASVAVVNIRLINRIREYTRLGLALSSDKDIQTLLPMIAEMARKYSQAEGCTVYLCNEERTALVFTVIQNTKLNINSSGKEGIGEWSKVELYHENGRENHSNASAYSALKNKIINIEDVYDEEGFDFTGTQKFDAYSRYRSQSMLLVPMIDHEGEVVGVLQLLNARKGVSRKVCPFYEEDIPMVQGLASQAAMAVTNTRLIQGLEDLLKAFIKSIATAIDEKSSYMGGHIQRVAKLTEMLLEKINQTTNGHFADTQFSADEKEEISIAAWMHDIGKIATPEYVIDKSTKLETVYDRIEVIRLRIELMKREQEIKQLRAGLSEDTVHDEADDLNSDLDYDAIYHFLRKINVGGKLITEKDLEQLEHISTMSYTLNGELLPLLNGHEMDCCAIHSGTLTENERLIINHHVVVSIMMLERLPFPKKWKSVPEYAGMHHEKLNGSGYPNGHTDEEITLPARILALADVFEALTAADRPYKVGKKLSEAMQIIKHMADGEHLDKELCNFMAECGLVEEYASQHLATCQVDRYFWNGKEY